MLFIKSNGYKYVCVLYFIFLQEVNQESIHMRDATKVVALRQEHSAQIATKSRTKLAFDFRQQVEDHKIELERLEKKLLTTSINLYMYRRKKKVFSLFFISSQNGYAGQHGIIE